MKLYRKTRIDRLHSKQGYWHEEKEDFGTCNRWHKPKSLSLRDQLPLKRLWIRFKYNGYFWVLLEISLILKDKLYIRIAPGYLPTPQTSRNRRTWQTQRVHVLDKKFITDLSRYRNGTKRTPEECCGNNGFFFFLLVRRPRDLWWYSYQEP